MANQSYLTAPIESEKMPGGIPYIVGNEAAERFSFYGMKAILFVFMTKFLLNSAGEEDFMTEPEARTYVHYFVSATYFFPIIGGFIADVFWGKYKTILTLSIVYCLGHLALALDDTRFGLFWGLTLIAIGSGGIKPCVSAHVGDQFGHKNQFLLPRVFSWFYFSINLGAFLSTLLTPIFLEKYNAHVAFGVPGALMFLATWVFWLGRKKFVHIPARGFKRFSSAFTGESGWSLLRVCIIFLFIAMFWSLFDQTASAWVGQADKMDRTIDLSWLTFAGAPSSIEPSAAQIQAANPALILLLIPLFSYVIYPALNRVFPLTPLRKISIGFFITAGAFSVSAIIESKISAGLTPHINWQLLAYVILTSAEIMVSITGLEFAYTQAPPAAKSIVMSLYLLSVSLGNAFTAAVNDFIQNKDGTSKLEGANYYWFFTGVMFATAVIFVGVAATYRVKTYIQGPEHVDVVEE